MQQRLTQRLIRWGGRNISRQIIALGILVGPISALINNTAVVSTFIPVIERWCKEQRISPSKLMMPLSYVTILGGMITVIGTSTNILASGISQRLGYGEFKLFQFTALGTITFLIGLGFLAIIGPKLLPSRIRPEHKLIDDEYEQKSYLSEIEISHNASIVGQRLGDSCLHHSPKCPEQRFAVEVLQLIRGGLHLSHALDQQLICAGDVLSVKASQADLLEIKSATGIKIHPEHQFSKLKDVDEDGFAKVLVLANSTLIGATLKESRFHQRYNLTVLAIRHREEIIRDRLSDISLKFGDVLLLQGNKSSISGLRSDPHLLLIEQQELDVIYPHKVCIALGIVVGAVLAAAFNLMPILLSSLIGVVLMVVTGCLKPNDLYRAVRWDVIFLLAGLVPLGIAMEKSGATQLIANALITISGNLPGYWLLTIFFIVTSVLTELLSNNAAVVLLIPIAAQVAERFSFNPIAFIFAITFAASSSFMTPIGYQTNTMVYGPGGYKFTDYLRVGLPLNVLMAVVTPPLIILFYGLQVPLFDRYALTASNH